MCVCCGVPPCQFTEMNSLIFAYPPIQSVLANIGGTQMQRLIVWLRTFGAASSKPLELRGSWGGFAYLAEIHRRAWGPTRTRSTNAVMDVGVKYLD